MNKNWVIVKSSVYINRNPEFLIPRIATLGINAHVEKFNYTFRSDFVGTERQAENYRNKIAKQDPDVQRSCNIINGIFNSTHDLPLEYNTVDYEIWSKDYYEWHIKEHSTWHTDVEQAKDVINYDDMSKEELIALLKKK